MAMSRSAPPPLSKTDITEALRRSGFPLEIRLLQKFHEDGINAMIGTRVIPGTGEKSAEVDLMAFYGAHLAEQRGFVRLTALIEAKQLGPRVNFVGFRWKQPEAHAMRFTRTRLSGAPTYGVLTNFSGEGSLGQQLLFGDDPIAKALDPLNESTVCPHWAYVRETKQNNIEARKEDDARESFAKLVRVTTWLEREYASSRLTNSGTPPLLSIQLLSPAIVLATENLYLYDPLEEKLETVDSLILQEMHEVGGTVHSRFIDVVTESALPTLMDRYLRVIGGLVDACGRHSVRLMHFAENQRSLAALRLQKIQ